jgi:PIN domain-containing protein
MFRLLIDTSVWLDLARDPKQLPVVGVVETMIDAAMLTLIVPHIVLEEFQQNRERIAKESTKSLASDRRPCTVGRKHQAKTAGA